MKLCEKIVYLRKKKGWSQEQLSIKLSISRQAVYKWEAGISLPEIDKLTKLSKVFGISYNDLLDDDIDIMEAIEGADESAKTPLPEAGATITEDSPEPPVAEADSITYEPEVGDEILNCDENSCLSSAPPKAQDSSSRSSLSKRLLILIISIVLVSALFIGAIIGMLVYFSQNGRADDKDET